jgi:hypothetical protein
VLLGREYPDEDELIVDVKLYMTGLFVYPPQIYTLPEESFLMQLMLIFPALVNEVPVKYPPEGTVSVFVMVKDWTHDDGVGFVAVMLYDAEESAWYAPTVTVTPLDDWFDSVTPVDGLMDHES